MQQPSTCGIARGSRQRSCNAVLASSLQGTGPHTSNPQRLQAPCTPTPSLPYLARGVGGAADGGAGRRARLGAAAAPLPAAGGHGLWVPIQARHPPLGVILRPGQRHGRLRERGDGCEARERRRRPTGGSWGCSTGAAAGRALFCTTCWAWWASTEGRARPGEAAQRRGGTRSGGADKQRALALPHALQEVCP